MGKGGRAQRSARPERRSREWSTCVFCSAEMEREKKKREGSDKDFGKSTVFPVVYFSSPLHSLFQHKLGKS